MNESRYFELLDREQEHLRLPRYLSYNPKDSLTMVSREESEMLLTNKEHGQREADMKDSAAASATVASVVSTASSEQSLPDASLHTDAAAASSSSSCPVGLLLVSKERLNSGAIALRPSEEAALNARRQTGEMCDGCGLSALKQDEFIKRTSTTSSP